MRFFFVDRQDDFWEDAAYYGRNEILRSNFLDVFLFADLIILFLEIKYNPLGTIVNYGLPANIQASIKT